MTQPPPGIAALAGLPQRWAGRERYVVLDMGFGAGHDFLDLWDAWRRDPARCGRLVVVGVERRPPVRAVLRAVHAGSALGAELAAAWPPLTSNLHPLDFECGRVQLLLACGRSVLRPADLVLRADAILLADDTPADRHAIKALSRRAAPGALAFCRSTAPELRAALAAAGFALEPACDKTLAQHRPRVAALPLPALPAQREAIVVGAGLAGAFTAQALAAEGWAVRVLERQAAPAQETSGNAAGLFHGTVHGSDGPHARLLRAGALLAERTLRPLIASAAVPGQLRGLLRLEEQRLTAMQSLIDQHNLPHDWVRVLDRPHASALAGVPLPAPAWFYPGGGWVAPAALVAHLLAGERIRCICGTAVHGLRAADGGWQALDARGAVLASAPVLVLANADGAQRLLLPLGLTLPLQRVRGQVSGWHGGDSALRLPVAGDGYALPLPGGGVLCGASSSIDDDPAVADRDDTDNFQRLLRLTGLHPPADKTCWFGRVGWRLQADDRLPVAGPVPQAQTSGRGDQARLWPRVPGLYLCAALGGRGITLAPLLGRLLAAQIAGAPLPLEQGLVDAIDPARWLVRSFRRTARRSADQG